jgi:tetratricopeptide (TPR) repeat protein
MSPEQAAAKVEELSPATDVYSLGATLYALLTNRAPFQGRVNEVVQQVERGAWLPPRQVNGSVPAALDAICRKAMALRPEERYATALALAEDVEHWLADEPVSAYAEPAGARLRRWMRKRPRRVTAAVVVLLTAVVGLTVGTVLLERSNREARENLEMVEGQANYFMQEVSADLLMNEPGMQPLRQRILIKVLDDYAGFLKKRPGDTHARQQMAGAKQQLGELYLQAGRIGDARALEVQAVALYEGLLREAPADRAQRFGLARARQVLADLQVQAGDPAEGKKEAERAIELLERLKAEEPGNGHYLWALGSGYDLRATAEAHLGNSERSLADNKRALEVMFEAGQRSRRSRANLFPGQKELYHPTTASGAGAWGQLRPIWTQDWPDLLRFGQACINQGAFLRQSGRNGEAARVLERAVAIYRRLHEQNRRAGPFRHGLALALLHSGQVQVELGLPGRAEPELREALGLMRQLAQDDPYVKEYRATRLLAAGYLGDALYRQGRTVAAAELLREVEKDAEDALAGSRRGRKLREQHARLLHVLGCLERESGDLDRGLGACQKADELIQQALRAAPGNRSLRNDRLANREALARCRFLKGSLSRAAWIAEQQGVLAERKELAGLGTPAPRFQRGAAESAAVLAGLLLEAGRPAQALACVAEALTAHEKVLQAEQARVKKAEKDRQTVEQAPAQANQTGSLRLFLREAPIVPDLSLRRAQSRLLATKGAALAQVGGRDREAGVAVRQAAGITFVLVWGRRHRSELGYLYDLACQLALASTLSRDVGPASDLASGAVLFLACSCISGYDNSHKLRTDPALEPLRQRDDFQQLLRDVEARRQGREGAPLNR